VNRVINATVLSNFAAIEQLDILRVSAGPLYLPAEVYDELVAGRLGGYSFYDSIEQHIEPFVSGGWLHLVSMADAELKLSLKLPRLLHAGERACLSIARQRGWGLLTDDRSARQQATAWNIPLSGTIGVLLDAIENGIVTLETANAALIDMIVRANYRSPVADLGELLQ